jgi:hypothetical protein
MRWWALLILCGCSNTLTAELITKTTRPGNPITVAILNDSLVEASWSPCDQAWFIETENGRVRDPLRPSCNLDTSIPFGASELTLITPEREGAFFCELRIRRQMTFVPIELGPLVLAH